jgi:hypothetical protein
MMSRAYVVRERLVLIFWMHLQYMQQLLLLRILACYETTELYA